MNWNSIGLAQMRRLVESRFCDRLLYHFNIAYVQGQAEEGIDKLWHSSAPLIEKFNIKMTYYYVLCHGRDLSTKVVSFSPSSSFLLPGGRSVRVSENATIARYLRCLYPQVYSCVLARRLVICYVMRSSAGHMRG